MHTALSALVNRFSRIALPVVFSLSMIACGGGGGGGPSNTAPVASDATLSLPPGTTTTGTLVAKDADGNALTFSIVTGPADGTLTIDDAATGAYTYVNAGNLSSDSFTFKANDGTLDSNTATVTITTSIPGAPASGLQATAGDESNKINWDPVPGADSYTVYHSYALDANNTVTVKTTGIKPPFYDNGLTNGTTYHYLITAVNTVGESAASTEVSATPANIAIGSVTPSFADSNLQTCVNASGATYVHDLKTLTCTGQSIADLSGIEALTSLATLNLSNNSITDISPLANMISLTTLGLSYNSLVDVSSLGRLTGLTSLYLNNNTTIVDVSPLASLTGLTILNLSSNSVADVSPLASMTSLTSLGLRSNSIADVSPLASMTSLTALDLYFNSIADVSPLASLTSLITLNLSINSIVDVSPLASLTSLTSLDLRFNSIGGQGVGHVDTLTSLTATQASGFIGLSGNIGMSCNELTTLIGALGSPPVDINVVKSSGGGQNCTSP